MNRYVDKDFACARCLMIQGCEWLGLVPQNEYGKCSICNQNNLVYHKWIALGRKDESDRLNNKTRR